jgi:two-component system response regulator (stage 0 sporulation protein A)
MDMRKILIADASEIWREKLSQSLGREYEVLACPDGEQALAAAERFRPDVVVLDLLLAGVDGLTLIKRLREWEDCPRFIVTGRYFSNYMTTALERYQVDELIMKPCTTQSVADHIAEVLSQDREEVPVCPDPFDYVTALLVRMGAPTSQQGFRFLRRGVMLMMEDPNQQLTKSLYPALADEFETSPGNVEKSLRTTVTTAWKRRREEVWRNYFPPSPSGQIPRPTVGQFLSRMADTAASMSRRRA